MILILSLTSLLFQGHNALEFFSPSAGILDQHGRWKTNVYFPGDWSAAGSMTGDHYLFYVDPLWTITQNFTYNPATNQTLFSVLNTDYPGEDDFDNGPYPDLVLIGSPVPEPPTFLPCTLSAKKCVHRFWFATILFALAIGLMAQPNHSNVFTGTWKLNAAKSKFSPGPAPPKSVILTITPSGKFTANGLTANGKAYGWSHSWSGNGEVPVEGINNASITSTYNGNTFDDTLKIGGKAAQKAHVVVSADGRTMTTMLIDIDEQGHQVHSLLTFDKQ